VSATFFWRGGFGSSQCLNLRGHKLIKREDSLFPEHQKRGDIVSKILRGTLFFQTNNAEGGLRE